MTWRPGRAHPVDEMLPAIPLCVARYCTYKSLIPGYPDIVTLYPEAHPDARCHDGEFHVGVKNGLQRVHVEQLAAHGITVTTNTSDPGITYIICAK